MRSGELRRPAVAGQFYEGSPSKLDRQVLALLRSDTNQRVVKAMVSPHAGFMYSGAVAGELYASIVPPEIFVLVGPNHTGLGAPVSVMSFGEWEIPGGRMRIAFRLAERILKSVDVAQEDEQAHLLEHSLEVQLPFIRAIAPEAKIVPIVLGDTSLVTCIKLGEGLAEAVRQDDRAIVLVASSDMSHFISDAAARKLDQLAIDRMLDMDPEGLHRVVRENGISMCGFGPATAVIHAAKRLGANNAELVRYMTSGDVSGDRDRVVGYAGLLFS